MKTKYFGYMRVSTREQNEDRQRISLKKAGIKDSCLFLDKQSGRDFNRSNYKKLISELDENSVLFITSIDRLGRNYKEIIEQWKIITQNNISNNLKIIFQAKREIVISKAFVLLLICGIYNP